MNILIKPIITEKGMDVIQQETYIKQQEEEHKEQLVASGCVVEEENIHQKMYEIATESQKTTVHLDPPGGSENFHGGPNGYGWMSGTGMNQFNNG